MNLPIDMFRKLKRYYYQLTHPIIGEVWQLHRVRSRLSEQNELRRYEVTPKRLETLILNYKQRGYDFVSMAEVHDYVIGKKKLKQKFVAVTLDDGYEDNLLEAYPIFEKYQVPFCIYITKQYITGEKEACDDVHFNMLSIDQIKTLLQSPLCTIGGHTVSHCRLSQHNTEEQAKEILDCNIWIEEQFKISVKDFAYPYGDYNVDSIEIVANSKIQQAVAAWGGDVRKDKSKVLCIPRKLVTQTSIE